MNQRNAIPANGTKSSANRTAFRRSGSVIEAPGNLGSAGAGYRTRTYSALIRMAKITPAMAAPRGGLRAFDALVMAFPDTRIAPRHGTLFVHQPPSGRAKSCS